MRICQVESLKFTSRLLSGCGRFSNYAALLVVRLLVFFMSWAVRYRYWLLFSTDGVASREAREVSRQSAGLSDLLEWVVVYVCQAIMGSYYWSKCGLYEKRSKFHGHEIFSSQGHPYPAKTKYLLVASMTKNLPEHFFDKKYPKQETRGRKGLCNSSFKVAQHYYFTITILSKSWSTTVVPPKSARLCLIAIWHV